MKAKMRFSLKAGERIFINGAVLTVNQRVTLSLLNDARFLLESHVLQMTEATSPMRQLYFVVQALLINPQEAEKTMVAFRNLYEALIAIHSDEQSRNALHSVRNLVESDRPFEALKVIRGLFEVDDHPVPKLAAASAEQAA